MDNIQLFISEDDPDVAYLALPEHPGRGTYGVTCKQVRLLELIPGYRGPDIYLDFNNADVLIGIEILA